MSFYIYDVGLHDSNGGYEEFGNTEFSNPVSVGDYITNPNGDSSEWKVFQVTHSSVGGGSCLHIRQDG